MPPFDYSRAQGTANRLIDKFGKTAVIRKPGMSGGTGYEPTRDAPSFHRVRVVETSTRVTGPDGLIRSVKAWMVRVLEGVVPEIDDQVMIDEAESFLANPQPGAFKPDVFLGSVEPLQPGDATILYTVTGRT